MALGKQGDIIWEREAGETCLANSDAHSSFRAMPSTWSDSATFLGRRLWLFYLVLLTVFDTCFGRLLGQKAELAILHLSHMFRLQLWSRIYVTEPKAKAICVPVTCSADRQNIDDSDCSLTKI